MGKLRLDNPLDPKATENFKRVFPEGETILYCSDKCYRSSLYDKQLEIYLLNEIDIIKIFHNIINNLRTELNKIKPQANISYKSTPLIVNDIYNLDNNKAWQKFCESVAKEIIKSKNKKFKNDLKIMMYKLLSKGYYVSINL